MVIEALKQRRETISADIRQLRENLAHIDAVIKMFDDDAPAKPRKQRGEVTRAMLNALRESGRKMTAQEIATTIGLDAQQVRIALTQQRVKDVVRRDDAGAWEIAK